MGFTAFAPGDRIRLVVLNVDLPTGESTRVTRRYGWTDSDPEHMCIADDCDVCVDGAVSTAVRRLGVSGSGKAGAVVTLLRDGQSKAR